MSTRPFVVLLHGHTASGKSTLARKLAQCLPKTRAVHSALVRLDLGMELPGAGAYRFDLCDPVFVETVSRRVYARLVELGAGWLEGGDSVIFDAAFNFHWQRAVVYELAQRSGVAVHAIRCICRDEHEVRRRLEQRTRSPHDAFSEASAYATYLSTREHAEDVGLDWGKPLGPASIGEYDSQRHAFAWVAQRSTPPGELTDFFSRSAPQQPAVIEGGQ